MEPKKNITPFDIDKEVKHIQATYSDELDRIFQLPKEELDNKRVGLINWISDPKNETKVIIAFSGGKDSIAMVLYALFVLQIPAANIELWHHDVDGGGEQLFDWNCTTSYCIAFAKAFELKILFSYANGGILREMYRTNETIQSVFFQKEMDGEFFEVKPLEADRFISTRRKFPAVNADLNSRWCSWIAKIGVMIKAINNNERYKNANIVIMTGERRLESPNRALYAEIEKYRGFTKTRRAVQWRPIIDFTDLDVWEIIRRFRVQPHPCYELGWSRCSCQLCIFSKDNTWASINDISPKKVERIAEIEKDFNFTLYAKRKRGEIINEDIYTAKVANGKSFIPYEKRKRWEAEALGEFVSPIIVDNWEMPAGAFSSETSGAT